MTWIRHASGEQTVIKNGQALGPESPLETDDDGYARVEDDDAASLLATLDPNVDVVSQPPEGDDEPAVESPPVDPSDLTVDELEAALEDDDYDWNQPALHGLREAEVDGKNRETALDTIDAALDERREEE